MAARFWVGGAGTWDSSTTTHWASSSGGAGGQSVPGASDDVTFDGSSGTYPFTVSLNYDPSINSITLTATSAAARGFLNSNVVGTKRTITLAAASTTTDWDYSDIGTTGTGSPLTGTRVGNAAGNSGITFTTGAPKYYVGNTANWNGTVWALTDGGAAGANNFPLPQDTATFTSNSFSANSQTVTVNGAFRLPSIDFSALTRTGVTFGCGGNNPSIYGDFKLTTAGTFAVSGADNLTFAGRNTQTITSSGVVPLIYIEISSLGGTVTHADNLTLGTNRYFTLTKGTWNWNGKALSGTSFSSTNSSTRSITAAGGTLTIVGGGVTCWNTDTATNMTLNDTVNVILSYNGGTGTRGIYGGAAANYVANFSVTAGTDILHVEGRVGSLNLTGWSGTFENAVRSIYGNVTFPAATYTATTSATTLAATSGTQVLTTNAAGTLDFPITINAPGATVQLADNLTLGTTRTLTHTAGTIDLNTKTASVGRFATSGSTARTLTDAAGTGKIITTDTTAATVFDATTTTNLTVDRTNAWTIEIGGNTTNIHTANLGAGKSWPAITFTNTTTNGELDIVSSGTATVIKSLAVSTPPQTIKRTAATTIGIEDANGFPAGTAGNLVTIGSITAATHTWARSGAAGALTTSYLSISRSTAPSNWDAGATSTDGGNNTGWLFGAVTLAIAKVMHHLKMLRG